MTEAFATFIGFGEAAQAFADGGGGRFVAYDRKTDDQSERLAKLEDGRRAAVRMLDGNAEAVADAELVLSLVTADQAVAAARETARSIRPDAIYADMNSTSPASKRQAAEAISAAGGRYLDVAVMAPVHPARRRVPLLVAGPWAAEGTTALRSVGFVSVRPVGDTVGDASAIKMIRSVMVKGLEALTLECLVAAEAAGVREEILASLDPRADNRPLRERSDYDLERMMVHGLRRASEMGHVVSTIEALGLPAPMSRATAFHQRAVGAVATAPHHGLETKLSMLLSRLSSAAERLG